MASIPENYPPVLLTILTPTLNCDKTLSSTMKSVIELELYFRGQIELLVGDGGSCDATPHQIEVFSNEHSFIQYFSLPGMNIPNTLNILLQKARGNYVMVLNGDDYLIPKEMTALLEILTEKPLTDVLCSYVAIESESGEVLGERGVNITALSKYMSVNHPGMLVSRRLFSEIGYFCEETPTVYDYAWTWEAYRKGVKFAVQPVVSAGVRLGGLSQRRARLASWEILCFKVKRGYVVEPLIQFGLFYLKHAARWVLPLAIKHRMQTIYRRRKNSIDYY